MSFSLCSSCVCVCLFCYALTAIEHFIDLPNVIPRPSFNKWFKIHHYVYTFRIGFPCILLNLAIRNFICCFIFSSFSVMKFSYHYVHLTSVFTNMNDLILLEGFVSLLFSSFSKTRSHIIPVRLYWRPLPTAKPCTVLHTVGSCNKSETVTCSGRRAQKTKNSSQL